MTDKPKKLLIQVRDQILASIAAYVPSRLVLTESRGRNGTHRQAPRLRHPDLLLI
jgi:hypothetical protein